MFPNGSAPMSAEPPKEAAHHAGPELQRTGRWVQLFLGELSTGLIERHQQSSLLIPQVFGT